MHNPSLGVNININTFYRSTFPNVVYEPSSAWLFGQYAKQEDTYGCLVGIV